MADLDDHQTLLADLPASVNGDPAVGEAAARRRTFAIISHPDAGKTTLTEKLLLFGGAIHWPARSRPRAIAAGRGRTG